MSSYPHEGSGTVEWAVRGRPISGETESGDLFVATEFENGMLLGVIDGLGHGPEAAVAARAAATAINQQPDRSVLDIIRTCHETLRGTRGAVLSLASIDASRNELSWAGVGNVEAVLVRADPALTPQRERIVLRSGVVGYQLPPLRATSVPIFQNDVLLFASDGIRGGFSEEPPAKLSAAGYADYILEAYNKHNDDTMVLVARYLGGTA